MEEQLYKSVSKLLEDAVSKLDSAAEALISVRREVKGPLQSVYKAREEARRARLRLQSDYKAQQVSRD